MVSHIMRILHQEILASPEGMAWSDNQTRVHRIIPVLAEELEKLEAQDFLPAGQVDFLMLRDKVRHCAKNVAKGFSGMDIGGVAKPLLDVLDQYVGQGSRGVARKFAFVIDTKLREIIERDYAELSMKLFASRAWKSTVVMAGSILEAILFDALSTDSATLARASASSKAPTYRGHVKDIQAGEWKLHELIEVAADLGILTADRAETVDRVLRDYRNFVHPKVEIRNAHPCTEAEALLAKGALDGVCNFLESKAVRRPV